MRLSPGCYLAILFQWPGVCGWVLRPPRCWRPDPHLHLSTPLRQRVWLIPVRLSAGYDEPASHPPISDVEDESSLPQPATASPLRFVRKDDKGGVNVDLLDEPDPFSGAIETSSALADELLEDPDRVEMLVLQEEGLPVDRSVARKPGQKGLAVEPEKGEAEMADHDPLDDPEGLVIKEKVDKMLQRKVDLWPPEQLFDMLPLLLRSDRVERAIKRRMREVGQEKERGRLQHSLGFIEALKYSEQDRLARQWVQGMLESMENVEAMDEAVFQLAAVEQGCLVKPVLDTLDDMLRRLEEMSPDEKTLTQHVLGAIRSRVEAEIKTSGKPFVRLLAACLRLKTPEERERLLRLELKNSRVIDEFAEFVEEGAEYTARARVGPFNLADDTPEQMKAIAAIVRSFNRHVPPTTPIPPSQLAP